MAFPSASGESRLASVGVVNANRDMNRRYNNGLKSLNRSDARLPLPSKSSGPSTEPVGGSSRSCSLDDIRCQWLVQQWAPIIRPDVKPLQESDRRGLATVHIVTPQ